MWRPDILALAERLTSEFGLEFEATSKAASENWPGFELRPAGMRREVSFAVDVTLGWRSIAVKLVPGAFAGPLVSAMGMADEGARDTFLKLAALCTSSRAAVTLTVDGRELDLQSDSSWPADWRRVALVLVKSPAVVNTEDYTANDAELGLWTRRYLNLALALMPLEELETSSPLDPEGLPEGAKIRIEVNRYERSRINRAACLELKGSSCIVCRFNFGKAFGSHGEGFIHVHHIVPVSQIGAGYLINPATDLVPLCPNCHAMAHRFDPPATVEFLRGIRFGSAADSDGTTVSS